MEYKVYYYVNSQNKKVPVEDYIRKYSPKDRAKIFKFIVPKNERGGATIPICSISDVFIR